MLSMQSHNEKLEDGEREKLDTLADKIKAMALEFNVPVITPCSNSKSFKSSESGLGLSGLNPALEETPIMTLQAGEASCDHNREEVPLKLAIIKGRGGNGKGRFQMSSRFK